MRSHPPTLRFVGVVQGVVLLCLIGAGSRVILSEAPRPAHSFGQWTPSKWDSCSKAFHDTFSVVAPDGKVYPTWHPPEAVDPASGQPCTFGHEHGRDPQGSALWPLVERQFGGLPFGYANEKLDDWNTANGVTDGMRHEDHVGHKVEWENHVRMAESVHVSNSPRRQTDVYCDVLMKAHQGTHSKDAFTNNLHELLYFAQCRDGAGGKIGTQVAVAKMVVFGEPGGFSEGSVSGGFTFIGVGPPMPGNSPGSATGLRSIPTITRVRESILVPAGKLSMFSQGLYEDWLSSNYVRTGGKRQILYFDPHFAVFNPSRFYDPSRTDNLGRSLEVCSMTANGGADRARGGDCTYMADFDPVRPFSYDDPRSAFNGAKREFYFNNTVITNSNGPAVWYTDPFGGRAATTSFRGSIAQFIAAVDNTRRDERGFIHANGRSYPFESVAIGGDRSYAGHGVHVPN